MSGTILPSDALFSSARRPRRPPGGHRRSRRSCRRRGAARAAAANRRAGCRGAHLRRRAPSRGDAGGAGELVSGERDGDLLSLRRAGRAGPGAGGRDRRGRAHRRRCTATATATCCASRRGRSWTTWSGASRAIEDAAGDPAGPLPPALRDLQLPGDRRGQRPRAAAAALVALGPRLAGGPVAGGDRGRGRPRSCAAATCSCSTTPTTTASPARWRGTVAALPAVSEDDRAPPGSARQSPQRDACPLAGLLVAAPADRRGRHHQGDRQPHHAEGDACPCAAPRG